MYCNSNKVLCGKMPSGSCTHEELLAKKGTYYGLYQTQFAGQET